MKKLIIGFLTFAILLSLGTTASAAIDSRYTGNGENDPTFGGVLDEGEVNLGDTIEKVVQWLFGFLGILAVLIIVYAGFLWMTAGGSDDKVKTAKKMLIQAVIGLIIILASYAIASFVFTEINNNVLQGGNNG